MNAFCWKQDAGRTPARCTASNPRSTGTCGERPELAPPSLQAYGRHVRSSHTGVVPTSRDTIAERLAATAGRDFVGREAELAALADATAASPFIVAFVHGPGGVGKSRLLRAALSGMPDDVRTLVLDGREIEPTPEGFLEALASAAGAAGPALADVLAALAADERRTVVGLDSYERLGLLDAWLRRVLLPALPAQVVTIIAGRDEPLPAWTTAPGWAGQVRVLKLGPLDQADSLTLLRSRGLDELRAARMNRFARGHPLALELAAAALRADPDLDVAAEPPGAVIAELLGALLVDLPPDVIGALEAAAISRRVTESILRSLLARPNVREEYEALGRLPFVERTPAGLVLHDLVREALARDLEERDPEAHVRYRRRAWSYFEARARAPVPERLWEITADLIYLIQNPVLRASCFPAGAGTDSVEPAVEADGPAILAIVAAHESPGATALLVRWWTTQPGTFSVARGPDGGVGAILHLARFEAIDPHLLADDPVARAWQAHARAVPPRPGHDILAMRRWLGRDSGEMLSPAVGACWLDVKRVYMQLRPRLSRLYSVMADPEALAPIFEPLGFRAVGGPVDVGGALHQPVWLDFGPESVDGWLRGLVGAEISAQEAALSPPPDDAGETRLTARELEVVRLITAGLSNRGIAERLVISEKTAGRHVSNIFCKLGVHNRAQATRVALERGIAEPRG
jgi:DNA-binding CsgD family transcriptional regulator